jgi:alpha-D-ribose 1-methylphosphonate 5-triphosphate synthase subunit PhnL
LSEINAVMPRTSHKGATADTASLDRKTTELLHTKGLTKVYRMGEVEVQALKGVDFAASPGEFTVILGPSGSGKSIFLNIVASNASIPIDRIHLTVRDGCVWLHGDVDWNYQRVAAIQDLQKLKCIKAISSDLVVKPPATEEALAVQKRPIKVPALSFE